MKNDDGVADEECAVLVARNHVRSKGKTAHRNQCPAERHHPQLRQGLHYRDDGEGASLFYLNTRTVGQLCGKPRGYMRAELARFFFPLRGFSFVSSLFY